MHNKIITIILIAIILALSLFWILSLSQQRNIIIQEAKMVTGVDKDMTPLKVTDSFPKNTPKVSTWISWKNAKINSQLLVRWYYVTDDVPIYDYNLNIPKKDGVANVIISMPEGKNLPSGLYKVSIFATGKKRPIKILSFKIE